MLLKCTADGRRIKVNGAPVNQANLARGMKMTMSTTPTMSARVHRKVMRAPHKRAHPGKMVHAGKMFPGKNMHPGKGVHPGKFAHLGKFGKLAHYAHSHALRPPEPCENSNDSGLGSDPVSRLAEVAEEWEQPDSKRRRESETESVKIECDDANDAYTFALPAAPALAPAPEAVPADLPIPVIRAGCSISSPSISETPAKRFQDPGYRSCGKLGSSGKLASTKYPGGGKVGGKLSGKFAGKLGGKYGGKLAQALARRRALAAMTQGPPGLAAPLSSRSRDGTVELQILCQPETQHRARYQTEGSRGAVKDNSGNGFPIVKLVGYDRPAVLQVFIGTDTGRVAPHMFYQACRVSGKNSTPCKEKKEDGTVVIEIDLEPAKNWIVTCDCVGILKERNVDVEHRFGEAFGGGAGGGAQAARGKKKSTRCRMVFRTEIVDAAGRTETLQVCSTQIICTQPPGVPEVSRKSLVSCPSSGGLELYLLGKNFLKETRVVFRAHADGHTWEEEVVPDKDFLQQTHLVCCVPACPLERGAAVAAQVFVRSGGKCSEPHAFYYTPPAHDTGPMHATRHHSQGEECRWGAGLMQPPAPPAAPPRRASLLPDPHEPLGLKSEVDDSSQHSLLDGSDGCGGDGDDTRGPDVMDLRLKSETTHDAQQQVGFGGGYDSMKLSPSTSSPSAQSFAQTLQAMHNQVQTDKMVESVTAAIFNSDNAGQMYEDQPIMASMGAMDPMRRLMSTKSSMERLETDMKAMNSELMLTEPTASGALPADRRLMAFGQPDRAESFNPFGAMTKMDASQIEERLARQTAHMDALVEDAMNAMKATAAIMPTADDKLDELVNSRVEDHLSSSTSPAASHASDVLLSPAAVGRTPPAPDLLPLPAAISPDVILDPQVSPGMLCDRLPPGSAQGDLMMMSDIPTSVKTPPAAVKSMILSAAAEILTSDSTMNALVTSAINTANILSTEGATQGVPDAQPPAEPAAEAPLAAMSHAVSQAVTQAVSQAVSHAVSQAVSQEMAAPVQGLTDMSDQDLLSYINPSTFDQV
ncbi:uncharacterized protein LOC121735773 isoform X3 [Aricia agestis]|uniref:uncharacterized protein LOC121735773 isoform X3 n=1 Tax=Aricia agestis TaxID=91739 RepID=UPI001C206962|nr:uncharacterized protein LOC121735773 isoform X3 [Aricia agestis]